MRAWCFVTEESQLKRQKVDVDSGADPSVQISETLANFFGISSREMPRSDITKRIWEYINVNKLQVVNLLILCCSLWHTCFWQRA